MGDLFESYLAMLGPSESPNVYHRWSLLTVMGAWLGRRYYLPFGDSKINCNMYVMLMGNAGARKTTAIHRATKLLKLAGYTNIAASKTSKEKFLMDLAGETEVVAQDNIMNMNLFGGVAGADCEMLIAADEFNVFVGNGNLEFLALLGTLWDYDGVFENKTKNSASVYISDPTVSILAGNTSTSFALAFPPEAIGQGIFSRLLLIQGEKTDIKITVPTAPDEETRAELITLMHRMRTTVIGAAELTPTAYNLLDKLYKTYHGLQDVRFESYNNRRLTHLIKLSMITAATELSKSIKEHHVLKANTILTHAEHSMPKALGEFGKAKNSDIANKVITVLEEARQPLVSFRTLWSQVHNDIENVHQFKELLRGLTLAGKIVASGDSFVAKRAAISLQSDEVDFNLLTKEERSTILL